MNRPLPSFALILGILGLIPFVVCGLGALANAPPNDLRALLALVAYGSVILAFLGGVHWGFALDADTSAPSRVQRSRLGLGVLPSLIGWVAILIALLEFERIALALLVFGFALTTVAEGRASRAGFVPRGYMGLRWVLSSVVVVVLVTVWLVLMLHGRIVLW